LPRYIKNKSDKKETRQNIGINQCTAFTTLARLVSSWRILSAEKTFAGALCFKLQLNIKLDTQRYGKSPNCQDFCRFLLIELIYCKAAFDR